MPPGRLTRFFRWLYRNRTISTTPEGKRFVVLTLAIGLAAVNTGNNLLYLMLAMMLSLIVLSGILSEQCLKHLSIVRRLPEQIFAGQPTTAHFIIGTSRTHLPSFSLRVMDVMEETPVDRGVSILYLAPGASILRPYPLLIHRRGRYALQAVKVLTRFPFSLFVKGLTIPAKSETVIYPAVSPLPEPVQHELDALGHDQEIIRRGQGADLYNLRLYQPGDDSRSIHWKTTARTNTLIVSEKQAEDRRRVTIVLPTLTPPGFQPADLIPPDLEQAFERAVELAASLAVHFQDTGFATGALIGDELIPYRPGGDQLHDMLRTLGLCQPRTPSDPATNVQAFGDRLSRLSSDTLTVMVLPWHDPRLDPYRAMTWRVVGVPEDREASFI